MKRWWKKIALLLVVASIFWGKSWNVMAEGTQIPLEVAEKYFGDSENKYYDVGASVDNGAIEIRSTSNSLKVGDTVEVQIIYNAESVGKKPGIGSLSLYYDKELLQYLDTVYTYEYVNGDYKLQGTGKELDKGVFLYFKFLNFEKPFDIDGCFATVQFTVKQETSAVTVYGGDIDIAPRASGDAEAYFYLDDLTDDGGYKMISVTIEDTSEPEPTPATGTFTLSDGTVKGTGEIQIPIKIQTNDGFAALGLTIDYDKDIFDYKTLEIDDNFKDQIALKDIYTTDGQIRAAYVAGQNITDVGDFLNLTLETKEGAPTGTDFSVTVTVTQAADYDEKLLNGTGAVYTVTLEEDTPAPSGQKLGDVNNDGSIDLVDALCILRYYNGVKELTDGEKIAADVNKNGDVDLVDALRIMKFYNGEVGEF